MQGHDSELQIRTGSCDEFSINPNKIIQEPNSAQIPITITKKKSKLDKNSIEYKIRKLDKKMCQTFQKVKKINKNVAQNEILEQELKDAIFNSNNRAKEEQVE